MNLIDRNGLETAPSTSLTLDGTYYWIPEEPEKTPKGPGGQEPEVRNRPVMQLG